MSDNETTVVEDSLRAFDMADDLEIPGFDSPEDSGGWGDEEEENQRPQVEAKTEEETQEQPQEESPEEQEAGPDEEKDAETPPPVAKGKSISFMMDGKAVPLDETAVVDCKVDGKTVPTTVKELMSNYAGKVAWDKRLNDVALDKRKLYEERTQFETGRETQRNLIKALGEQIGQGKTLKAVQTLVKMTGLNIDGREYTKSLRDGFIEQAKQLAQMTPEQRQLFELNEEREYQAEELAQYRQQMESERAQRESQHQVAKLIQENGLTQDEYIAAYDFLRQNGPQSGIDPSKLTPEFVVEHRKQVKIFDTARNAISAVEPDALDEQGLVKDQEKWKKFARIVQAFPDLTAEELADIYKEQRKDARAKNVSKKVLSASNGKPPPGTTRPPQTKKKVSPTDFTKFSQKDMDWVRNR